MVRGLDVFREHFAGHADQFVLIGGTAATLAMEEAGLEFRATKDLDIVLHIEALSPSFGEVFWRFVEAGGYEIRQASDTGKPVFYRFQKPADDRFPAMLELFCRAPVGIRLAEGSHLTPIPIDEAVASLSAILLDDAYCDFILAGRREVDGLPWVGEDRLIPLKASAWLDLGERQAKGEPIDTRNILVPLPDRQVGGRLERLVEWRGDLTARGAAFSSPRPSARPGSAPYHSSCAHRLPRHAAGDRSR